MNNRVGRLRSRLHALSRGKAPTGIRYPVELRAEVVGLVREARDAGVSVKRLAAGLGLPPYTLVRWLRRAPRRSLRRVTVTPAPPPPPALVLVTPEGWRVEGLDVATVLHVLQRRT
jgi:transposase-like protein